MFALNGDGDPGDPQYRNEIRSAVGASRFVDISGVSGVQVRCRHLCPHSRSGCGVVISVPVCLSSLVSRADQKPGSCRGHTLSTAKVFTCLSTWLGTREEGRGPMKYLRAAPRDIRSVIWASVHPAARPTCITLSVTGWLRLLNYEVSLARDSCSFPTATLSMTTDSSRNGPMSGTRFQTALRSRSCQQRGGSQPVSISSTRLTPPSLKPG